MIGGGILACAEVKGVTIEATVTRADGTVEPYGVVAGWKRDPLSRWWLNLRIGWWNMHRWLKRRTA